MNRETIASVPVLIESQEDVRRFLQQLVDRIDVVLGFKGDTKYLTSEDLTDVNTELTSLRQLQEDLSTVETELTNLKTSVEEAIERIDTVEEQLAELDNVKVTEVLDASFYDLNYSGWDTKLGELEFSAEGSEISNAPIALDGSTTYNILASSIECQNYVRTELLIVSPTDIEKFIRVGSASTWVHLAKVVVTP